MGFDGVREKNRERWGWSLGLFQLNFADRDGGSGRWWLPLSASGKEGLIWTVISDQEIFDFVSFPARPRGC